MAILIRLLVIVAFMLLAETAEAQGDLSEVISIIRSEATKRSEAGSKRIAEIYSVYAARQKELGEADWRAINSGLIDPVPFVRDQTCAVLAATVYINSLNPTRQPIAVPEATREILVQRFGESAPNLRENAVRVIALMAGGVPRNLATPLRQMAQTDNAYNVRRVATVALAAINPPDPETTQFWVQSLSDVSKPDVRGMVLSAFRLNSPSDPRVISLVIDALKDSDRFVRQEAIAAIMRIGKPAESALPLLEQIRDTDTDLRGNADAAIRALKQ